MLYTITITPYRVSFIENDTEIWQNIDHVIDALFGLDLIFNCFLAYEFEETLITNKWKIFTNYAKTWMILDLISCFPFQVILDSSSWGGLVKLSKLPRLYRLMKIMKLVRLFKVLKNRNKVLSCLECFAKLSAGMERLIYFLLGFLTICHLIACFLYFISRFNSDNINNWVYKYGIEDETVGEKYLASVYWTITTLCTIGYGDITPASDIERGLVIFVELAGVFFYSYTIGTITSLMAEMDKRKSKVNAKLGILQEIAKKYNLSRKIYDKLKSALEYNQGLVSRERADMIKYLPRKLAMSLNLVMNKTLIDKNQFFEGKSLKFITSLLLYIRPLRVKPRETIYRKGEFTEEMYFIKTGEVGLFDLHMGIDVPFDTLFEGDYFGDIEVFLSEVRETSAKALKAGELYTLSREELFANVLFYFQDLKLAMIIEANSRRDSILRKRDEFLMRHLQINNFTSMQSEGSEVFKSTQREISPNYHMREYAALRKTLAPTTRAMLEENDDASIDELRGEIDKLNIMIQDLEDLIYANQSRINDAE